MGTALLLYLPSFFFWDPFLSFHTLMSICALEKWPKPLIKAMLNYQYMPTELANILKYNSISIVEIQRCIK